MIGLPPKIAGFVVMRSRSVSSSIDSTVPVVPRSLNACLRAGDVHRQCQVAPERSCTETPLLAAGSAKTKHAEKPGPVRKRPVSDWEPDSLRTQGLQVSRDAPCHAHAGGFSHAHAFDLDSLGRPSRSRRAHDL